MTLAFSHPQKNMRLSVIDEIPPVLDLVGNAAFAFSVNRKLRGAYAGSILDTVSAKVSLLYDQSGNARNIAQGTDGDRPDLIASVINGRSGMRFDGTADYLFVDSLGAILAQPMTFICLALRSNLSNGRYMWDSRDGANRMANLIDAGNADLFSGVEFKPFASSLNAYEIRYCVYNGVSSKYSINAGAESTGNAGSGSLNGFTLGNRFDPNNPAGSGLQGDVLELLAYNSLLSAAEKTLILNNLNAYYRVY